MTSLIAVLKELLIFVLQLPYSLSVEDEANGGTKRTSAP